MDTGTEGYLAFVVLGTALVVVVGLILTRSGRVYLQDVFPDRRTANSVSVLLSVLFYLFALGLLGVISTMSVPVTGTAQTVVTKLGVVLLVLGVVFGATMIALARIRARRAEDEKQEQLLAAMPGVTPTHHSRAADEHLGPLTTDSAATTYAAPTAARTAAAAATPSAAPTDTPTTASTATPTTASTAAPAAAATPGAAAATAPTNTDADRADGRLVPPAR